MRSTPLAVIAALLVSWPVLVAGQGSDIEATAFEHLAISSTAVSLDSTTIDPADARPSQYCEGTVELADIRVRIDGTAPTTSVGALIEEGQTIRLRGANAIRQFQAIRDGSTDADLPLHCYPVEPYDSPLEVVRLDRRSSRSVDQVVLEGATRDENEVTVSAADVTADVAITYPDDSAGTYYPLTQPLADVTGGFWNIPEVASADAELTMSDDVLYVYRVYLPSWLTVANVRLRGAAGANIAGADDILGVSVYEDADAGAALLSGSTADFTGTANGTIDNADVTLGPGFYRLAVCSGDGDGVAFVGETVDDEFIDVANLGAVAFGTGANTCTAGVPPATTGALSTADINIPVVSLGP